jgi:murein DD-endopeptidase MepM/ murein hydrolase activator NlpD
MNLHRYVGNDPVNFVDPSGLIVGMAVSLASAVKNRPNGSYDGNPFNGVIPNTAAPTPNIPNSNLPQGKTATPATKFKVAQTTPKSAAPAGKDGAKVKGEEPKPKEDEKCKDQTWHDPIDNPQLANYTQGGGEAPYWNVFGTVRNGKMHKGVDLLAMPGTPVYACADGTIVLPPMMRPRHKGGANYGHTILLKAKCPTFVRGLKEAYSIPYKKQGEMEQEDGFKDDGDFYFFYAHLLEVDEAIKKAFQNGEKVEVKAGDKIGKTGTSGYTTSADPHLHFEILSKPFANRMNPGFYMHYKLPGELTLDESASQKEIAKKKQGNPSIEK